MSAGIQGLIELVLYLLVGGLVIWIVYWIIGMLTLPPQVKTIILIIVAIVVLLWLLATFNIFRI
jgi:uncharacterized membrane-anchored protein